MRKGSVVRLQCEGHAGSAGAVSVIEPGRYLRLHAIADSLNGISVHVLPFLATGCSEGALR
jgi:hypothetical protein